MMGDKRKELTQEGVVLFRMYAPDLANTLKLEGKDIPLESVYKLIETNLYFEINLTKIVEMIDRGAEKYLRYIAQRNLYVGEYLHKVSEYLIEEQGNQIKMKLVKLH